MLLELAPKHVELLTLQASGGAGAEQRRPGADAERVAKVQEVVKAHPAGDLATLVPALYRAHGRQELLGESLAAASGGTLRLHSMRSSVTSPWPRTRCANACASANRCSSTGRAALTKMKGTPALVNAAATGRSPAE